MSKPGENQGTKLCCTMRTYGLQFEELEAKKLSGFVVKWFHLIGSTYDAAKTPTTVDLYHARKQTFGTAGFRDKDPAPEETGDAKSLTIAKYPKLNFQQVVLTFTSAKMANRMHKAIQKRLRKLGQGTPFFLAIVSPKHACTAFSAPFCMCSSGVMLLTDDTI